MSTPPGNYYGAPPPRSNSGGCWKAAGITCGLLVVACVVLVFFGVRAAKNAISHGTGVFGVVGKAMRSAQEGQKIQKAVVKYHDQHGKYPDTLMALVSEGLVDGKDLHSDLDSDPNPGHVSWHYTKPAEGAPGNTPILTLHYRITLPNGSHGQQSQEGDMTIDLNGSNGSSSSSGSYHSQYNSSGG